MSDIETHVEQQLNSSWEQSFIKRGNFILNKEFKNVNVQYAVAYGDHFYAQPIEDIPSDDIDTCIFLEGINWYFNDPAFITRTNFIQYRDIVPAIGEKGDNIFLGDISGTFVPMLEPVEITGEPVLEGVVASIILKKFISFNARERFSRRNFLKNSAGLVAATYFGIPILINTLELPYILTGEEYPKQIKDINKLDYKIHPELSILIQEIRNTLFAYKMMYISREIVKFANGGIKNLRIMLVIGRNHNLIEDKLNSSMDELLAYFKLPHINSIIKALCDPVTFAGIAGCAYNNETKKWYNTPGSFLIPELEKLFS